MTAQVLNNELVNLIQEAKRKNSELRNAAESALGDLKSISSRPENEVVQELASRPSFSTPFIIACRTKNVKFTAIGVSSLQRLIVAKALARTRLKEVLEAFREATNLGVEIQLKILQALPPLLQNYANDLQGDLLAEALIICSILQSSKLAVVNNTAAATLQQLVITVFDKVVVEDERALKISATAEVPSENENILVRPAALDAYRVFLDMCLLTEGQKPQFHLFNNLAQTFGLELIESVLTNHGDVFLSHPEQAQILRARVVPFVIRCLSERLNFPTTVRIIRVLYIILRRHLAILAAECEVALGLLIHMLDPDAAMPWKRALCMEIIKGCFAEPALIRRIYSLYDAQEGRKAVIRDLSAALARLATEKPSIIGLGTQSSVPVGHSVTKDASSEAAAMEAGGVAGVIGGAVGLGEITVAGLSTQWSMMRVPCIDQLDKTGAPVTPDSYIYALTLTCINSFSEGLAKFIIPFSNPNEGLKTSKSKRLSKTYTSRGLDADANSGTDTPDRSQSPLKGLTRKRSSQHRKSFLLVNPLTLDTPLKADIALSANMVENCWPALLAGYSTFLYATLDNDLYHSLVRSLQKFTQVAGILGLNTPRDAFLTTLGKAAVPSNILSAHLASLTTSQESYSGLYSNAKALLSVDSLVSPLTITSSERSFSFSGAGGGIVDHNIPALNARNLICLRALLNLGTALGPTLENSWTIILETLQQADFILYSSSRKTGRTPNTSAMPRNSNDPQGSLSNITSELAAVENTATRMFQGTRDFPDEPFVALLLALCKLLGLELLSNENHLLTPIVEANEGMSPLKTPLTPNFQRRGSVINTFSVAMSNAGTDGHAFALMKLGEVAQINISRLIGKDSATNGWDLLLKHLTMIIGSRAVASSIRLRAADVLHDLSISVAKTVTSDSNIEGKAEVQRRILNALLQEIYDLADAETQFVDGSKKAAELDIHKTALETLYMILELSGESLVSGWDILFDIINTVFDKKDPNGAPTRAKSSRLIKSSFSSLQLICSDFLAVLPLETNLVLVDSLYAFSEQKEDLNIALTTITFFWNVSDFLQSKKEESTQDFDLPKDETRLLQNAREGFIGANPHMALWMILLLRLAGLSRDERPEVRNGSIQTLFRIFDTYGHQLGPKAWDSCLKIVVFKMMQNDLNSIDEGNLDRKQWDETISLILSGIGTLYANYFDIFSQQADFESTWEAFVVYLRTLFLWESYEINTTVFKELHRILEKANELHLLDKQCQDKVWDLWVSQGANLVENIKDGSKGGVQGTLTAYVDVFKPLYRLLEPTITSDVVKKALGKLQECMIYPDAPAYFSDVDVLTPLQTSIMACFRLIRTDVSGVSSLILNELASFCGLPYQTTERAETKSKDQKVRRLTYIAVAHSSMRMIESTALKHVDGVSGIYDSGSLCAVLSALAQPINLKYNSQPASLRSPTRLPLWIQATNVSLAIIKPVLSTMDTSTFSEEISNFIWRELVHIIAGVVTAHTKADKNKYLREDELHDIQAFRKLRLLLVPRLGRPVLEEETIVAYVNSIYLSSLLYEVPELELSLRTMSESGWKTLQGSTSDLILEERANMSYVCADELFLLSEDAKVGAPEWARLAKVAVPYMIHRTAIVLRRFIADQPIRGRMPQPRSQRKELLYFMKKIVELCSSVDAVDILYIARDVTATTKNHLFKLFPLLSQTIAVAQGDKELLSWLSKALDEVGMIFTL